LQTTTRKAQKVRPQFSRTEGKFYDD